MTMTTTMTCRCPNCGHDYQIPSRYACGDIQHVCPSGDERPTCTSDPAEPPRLLERAANAARAAWRAARATRRKATDAEIAARWADCEPCEHRDRERNRCNLCGCPIGKRRRLRNKLAWATESCPVGKWRRTDQSTDTPPTPTGDPEP